MRFETMRKRVCFAMLCMARQCWEQGIAAQAMLEIGDEEALLLLARDCVARQHVDGRLCDVEGTPAIVDPAICVEAVLRAGEILSDKTYRRAAMRNLHYLRDAAPRSSDGACYQLLGGSEIWADSLGMGPHVLLVGGFIEDGLKLYWAIKRRLYDADTGLFRHKWDEATGKFTRPCFWAIGNGWAMTGLMRMAKILKRKNHPALASIANEFRALFKAMLPYQQENGSFHDVLDDPSTFYETESTEMFAYSVLKMVSLDLLPREALDSALAARAYAIEKVDRFGVVQGAAGSPTFEEEGVSTECQAHFLMMEAAYNAMGLD